MPLQIHTQTLTALIILTVAAFLVLWRIDPLLSHDSVTTTVSGQWLGKHVTAATNTRATIELLLETGCFYVVRAEML
jgi:hypothetical protein